MIAAWMLWSAGIGLLFLLAGLAAERLLTLGGRPTRWVWLVTGVATAALSALRIPGAAPPPQAAPPQGYVPALLEPLAVTVPRDSMLRSFDDLLVLGWVVLSSLLMVTVLFAFARLVREGRSWQPGSLGNRSVLWSRDTGPTTVGLLRPRVVLPAWVRAIGASEQELILAHEEEHIRAGDARLRFLMTLPLLVFPWNPALWLQRHRLGLAVELDCDRRVMRRMPGHRRIYGNLLLRVGAGRSGLHRLALVSLSEGRSQLDRRIKGLVKKVPRARRTQGLLLLLSAAVVVAFAVLFPRIRGEGGPAEGELADLMAEPTPTPYTVRPDLLNQMEIMRALQAEYPPMLRDAGIGGTANVRFFIDTEGVVRRVLVAETSGHEVLDSAALRVARVFRFTPALDEDEVVPVWIAIPITFTTSGDGADAAVPEEVRQVLDSLRRERAADPGDPPADAETPQEASIADAPTFTPFTERPDLLNEEEVMRALDDEYPPLLRDAGVGGTVQVHFFIDTEGVVQRVLVAETSGHQPLDEAALRVARLFRFTPARNQGELVPVWIAIPLTFQPDDAGGARQADASPSPGPPTEPADPEASEADLDASEADPQGADQLADLMREPTPTPFTAPPAVSNQLDVHRALEREYPRTLRDEGIGGTVPLHLFIDAEGVVQRVLVAQPSGHEGLDSAAVRVARVFRFSPARDGDEAVPVWIVVPIQFQTR